MISERDVIYITKKQASLSVAILAMLCLLIFMLGYFWGKQSVLDGFGQRVMQESAQDQADYMSTMQSFVQKVKSDLDSENQQEYTTNPTPESSAAPSVDEQVAAKQDLVEVVQPTTASTKKTASNAKKYRATLLGFGTKQAALAFVNRLKKHNISVEVRPRTSKSASGKAKRTWYQVVTRSYDSKDDVHEVVNRIKKFERIKDSDIKIV